MFCCSAWFLHLLLWWLLGGGLGFGMEADGSLQDFIVEEELPPPQQQQHRPQDPPSETAHLFQFSERQFAQLSTKDPHYLQAVVDECHSDRGMMLLTDFSGMAAPEMASQFFLANVKPYLASPPKLVCWRASDFALAAHKVLLAQHWCHGPRHVFGNILKRVPRSTLPTVLQMQDRVQPAIDSCMQQSGMTKKYAVKYVGDQWMASLRGILQEAPWDVNMRRPCYRCQRRCLVHAPGEEGMSRLAIAGTVCKSFSAIGKGLRHASQHATSMLVWAVELTVYLPEIAIHECVASFDPVWLLAAIGGLYFVESFVFSSQDLGEPYKRRRRWTIALKKSCRAFKIPMKQFFPTVFFGELLACADIYFFADEDTLALFKAQMAEAKHLVSHASIDFRSLMKETFQGRLNGYEKLCRRLLLPCNRFVVNLLQTAKFARLLMSDDKVCMPTLLCNTSYPYSMHLQRPLHITERLAVHNIPTSAQTLEALGVQPFGIHFCLENLRDRQVQALLGNSMSLSQMHSVMLYVMATTRRQPCMPTATPPMLEDGDDDEFVLPPVAEKDINLQLFS